MSLLLQAINLTIRIAAGAKRNGQGDAYYLIPNILDINFKHRRVYSWMDANGSWVRAV